MTLFWVTCISLVLGGEAGGLTARNTRDDGSTLSRPGPSAVTPHLNTLGKNVVDSRAERCLSSSRLLSIGEYSNRKLPQLIAITGPSGMGQAGRMDSAASPWGPRVLCLNCLRRTPSRPSAPEQVGVAICRMPSLC
jgi:hypothetical protein